MAPKIVIKQKFTHNSQNLFVSSLHLLIIFSFQGPPGPKGTNFYAAFTYFCVQEKLALTEYAKSERSDPKEVKIRDFNLLLQSLVLSHLALLNF